MDKILGIAISLGMVGFGLGCFNSKLYREWVKALNAGRGLKTTITSQTDQFGKVIGVISIILGIFLFLAMLPK